MGEGGGRRVGREEERKQGVVGVGGGDNRGVVSCPAYMCLPASSVVLV